MAPRFLLDSLLESLKFAAPRFAGVVALIELGWIAPRFAYRIRVDST